MSFFLHQKDFSNDILRPESVAQTLLRSQQPSFKHLRLQREDPVARVQRSQRREVGEIGCEAHLTRISS